MPSPPPYRYYHNAAISTLQGVKLSRHHSRLTFPQDKLLQKHNLNLLRLQHPTADLVALDRFEQGLEIAFAEALVALALDELEKYRAQRVG